MKNKSFNIKRLIMLALLGIFVVTMPILIGAYARYSSEHNINGSVDTGRFVISATPRGNDKKLVLIPSEDGSYAAYEFYVSNADGSGVSDVAQYYNIRISVPTEAGNAFFEEIAGRGLGIIPVLVRTDSTEYNIDELIYFAQTNSIPADVKIELYGITAEKQPDNSFEVYPSDNETLTEFTWFKSDGVTPVSFEFNAATSASYRHFIVFFASGITLDEDENYSLDGIQIIAYSEQIPPTAKIKEDT